MARNENFIKAVDAEEALAAFTIVQPGANDGGGKVATATSALLGVTSSVDAASGDVADVVRAGIAEVIYGGTIAAGDPVTSDASGHAVKAAPAAGANANLIGFAEVAGVSGDRGSIQIARGVMQGA